MTPRILLVGYGKFGREHFEALQKLDQEKHIILAGVVTKNKRITSLPGTIPTHTNITPSLLRSADAVIIVTPVSTHYTLTKKCLPYAHVFVEKPLAMTTQEGKRLIEEARRRKKILAVGHIFRFNHAVEQLKKIIRPEKERLYYIEGRFTGGSGEPAQDCGVVTSDMHLVDVLDYILGVVPSKVYCRGWTHIKGYPHEDQASLILDYPENIHVYLKLGWIKAEKIRSLVFYFPEKEISVDLLVQTIMTREYGKKEKILHCYEKQPLRIELQGFIAAIKTGHGDYVSGEIANRIVEIVEKSRESMKKKKVIVIQTASSTMIKDTMTHVHKTKIAVIGGGVFGVSIARELASFANVTLFERNDEIFGEASLVNQNRHHYGYHYHQSGETAEQCKIAKKDFEAVWGGAMLKDFPSYYCVAKKGSALTPNEFINFCKKYNLFYKEEWPSTDILNHNEISACFKTFEPVYDRSAFKSLAKKELHERGIDMRVAHEVKSGRIANGKKVMTMKHEGNIYTEEFDHVINATYTNINVFCTWFDFPRLKMDFRLKELLYIHIPQLHPIGITIMDKFVSVLPVDSKGLFSLGDVIKSFREKKISSGGVPWTKQDIAQTPSHRKDLLEGNFHFIPILTSAKLVEANWTVLPVKAWLTNDDNRTTEVIAHGQGCWSVLAGKIITSVNTAKKVAYLIRESK